MHTSCIRSPIHRRRRSLCPPPPFSAAAHLTRGSQGIQIPERDAISRSSSRTRGVAQGHLERCSTWAFRVCSSYWSHTPLYGPTLPIAHAISRDSATPVPAVALQGQTGSPGTRHSGCISHTLRWPRRPPPPDATWLRRLHRDLMVRGSCTVAVAPKPPKPLPPSDSEHARGTVASRSPRVTPHQGRERMISLAPLGPRPPAAPPLRGRGNARTHNILTPS
jgi:hypothetical protein